MPRGLVRVYAATRKASMCALAALMGVLSMPVVASGTSTRHRHGRGHSAQRRRALRTRGCPGANLVPLATNVLGSEQATLCLVNRERSARGLPALSSNPALDAAAARHSSDMVARDYLGHRSPAGGTVQTRVRATGYMRTGSRVAVGENVATAGGQLATPENVVQGWMSSPAHRSNLLGRGFRASGIGIVLGMPGASSGGWGGSGATYTEDFGSRR